MKKITTLDYAILGILIQSAKSGYSIRKQFETTALGNYSSSQGTIYPALRRLEKNFLIEKRRDIIDDKSKFFLTLAGKTKLTEWLLEPLNKEDVEKRISLVLLKFAFMESLVHRKDVISFLESFRNHLIAVISDLRNYINASKDFQPLHGKLALNHGLTSYKSSLKWCKTTLTELSKI